MTSARKVSLALLISLALSAIQLSASPTSHCESKHVLACANKKLNEAISKIIKERPPVDEFGVVLANIHDFAPDLKLTAKRELDFTDRLQIVSVQKGSVADELGLRPGDQLLQINSFYVSRGETALEKFSQRVLPAVDWQEPLNTTIIRDGFGQSRSLNESDAES
ncbi:PDZ domain-containing protein [Pelagicoccus mobilis]|uniref:PDZ domain-containing protein n=1 Tax=Pelagicoccus mobilis TaxID=415221 RepID=A0A934VSL6_9BACT|nr:PDZ domain-containing protein [Pelagicoccus mobilis]MBK1880552.1 hypothetical protein [Pelagicoccus mobilis]